MSVLNIILSSFEQCKCFNENLMTLNTFKKLVSVQVLPEKDTCFFLNAQLLMNVYTDTFTNDFPSLIMCIYTNVFICIICESH